MNKSELTATIVDYMTTHENEWGYSLNSNHFNPEEDGVSNCSAFIWWLANKFAPESDIALLGHGYTGTFVCEGEVIACGNTYDPLPALEPLDIIIVDRGRFTPDYDHCELHIGDNMLWGAGYSPLPHVSGIAQQYVKNWDRWCVVRFTWGCDDVPFDDNVDRIAEDGWWGTETTLCLQHYLGTIPDGIISHQWGPDIRSQDRLSYGWEIDATCRGSHVIRALQRHIGMDDIDGCLGHKTVSALQHYLDRPVTGTLCSEDVVTLQKWLNYGIL